MNRPNISNIHDCYGCGVCSKPCPVNIIDLRLNGNGFYEPFITEPDKCIHCGLCRDVCAYIKDKPAQEAVPIASYAAWSKDRQIQRKCSSGGAGFEIAKYLLGKGYKTVGVRYNAEEGKAEHFIASTVEELIQTIGSKYIQSYPVDGWKGIDRKGKYLITGTPCQIDSFRNYMKRMRLPEENFILLDFFCHGVPSMFAWQKYCKDAEKTVGKITYASWRNKWTGWHDSWAMGMDGENKGEKINWHDSHNVLIREKKTYIQSRWSQGNKFYQLFLGNSCLGPQCYFHCKYKWNHSSADIRIGDLWGKTYENNEDGVSAAIAFSQKGRELLAHTDLCMTEHPFDAAAEGQMHECARYFRWYEKVMRKLRQPDSTIDDVINTLNRILTRKRRISQLRHPMKTIYSLITHISKKN